MEQTIAVDFDGVIHKYSKGWHDGTIYDQPIAGAKQTLWRLRRAGFKILIYSTRAAERVIDGAKQQSQEKEIREYLDKHKIPYDKIWTGDKPLYTALIDDRAVRFPPTGGLFRWLRRLLRISNPWSECEAELERLGILKPGWGEEP